MRDHINNRNPQANANAQNIMQNPNLNGTGIGGGTGGNPNGGSGNNAWQPEIEFLYFYHPDHLGSTSYVTDQTGKLYEHIQYFPFGESWIEEGPTTRKTPYLFTSKELDPETGLYYFGARYYEPRTSVWQSADVVMDRYLDGKSKGGVHNPANLNFYGYGYQNPVKYTDPDGKWVETAWDVFNIGLGVASFADNVKQGNYWSAALDAAASRLGMVRGHGERSAWPQAKGTRRHAW